MTGTLTLWAYVRGARGPILVFASGALTGVGAMVGLTVLFFWSRPAFYAVGVVAVLAAGIRLWASYRSKEMTRLSRYEKGLHDHLRDHSRGQKKAVRAMAAITKETVRNGEQATKYAKYMTVVGRFQLGHQFIVWLAARSFRKSAARFSKQAQRLASAHQLVITAGEGVVRFWTDADNTEQIKSLREAMTVMQGALRGTIPRSVGYSKSVRTSPNMSRAYNAAKTELADAIDATVGTFNALDDYCTRLLKQTEEIRRRDSLSIWDSNARPSRCTCRKDHSHDRAIPATTGQQADDGEPL